MTRLALGVIAAAIILAVAIVMITPRKAFAAECRGQWMVASWYGAERILIEPRLGLSHLRLCLRLFADGSLNLKLVLQDGVKHPIANALSI